MQEFFSQKKYEEEEEEEESYLESALEKFDLGDNRGALEILENALKSIPINKYSFLLKFKCKFELKEFESLIKDLTRVIKLFPNNPEKSFNSTDFLICLYESRGRCKFELDDYQGAIDDYTKQIKLEPFTNDGSIFYNIGHAKFKLNDCKSAIDDLGKAINFFQNGDKLILSNTFDLRGDCKSKLEEYESAYEDYTQAINLNPNSDEPYNKIGLIEQSKEEYLSAIRFFTKAIEFAPSNGMYFSNRGCCKMYLNEYKGADEDLTMASDLNYSDQQLFRDIGICKLNQGNYKGAIENFSIAVKLNPEDSNYEKEKINICRKILEDNKDILSEVNSFEKSSIYNFPVYKRYSIKETNDRIVDFYKKTKNYFSSNTFINTKYPEILSWHLISLSDFFSFIDLLKEIPSNEKYRSKDELIKILSYLNDEKISLFIVINTKGSKLENNIAGFLEIDNSIILNADFIMDIDTVCSSISHEMIHYIQKQKPLNLDIVDSRVLDTSQDYADKRLNEIEFRCELEAQTYQNCVNFIPEYFQYFKDDYDLLNQKYGFTTGRGKTIEWICENKLPAPFSKNSNPRKTLNFITKEISYPLD